MNSIQTLWMLAGIVSTAPGPQFHGPQVIDAAFRTAWTAAGDFNHDGSLDLAAVEGTDRVSVFFHDASQRDTWTPLHLSAGIGCYFVLTGDFDSDGVDDLAIADPGSNAFLIHSKGNGTFDEPKPLVEAQGPRWLAAADFNGDGKLDLATADFMARTSTIFMNAGNGELSSRASYRVKGRPHAMQALDFDGDGRADLAVKLSDVGIEPLRGNGDGTFEDLPLVTNLGTDGNIATGDFNHDGKGDLLIYCCGAAVSQGDGTFLKTLNFDGFSNSVFGDIDRDGNLDILQVNYVRDNDDRNVLLHLGNGDGSFTPPVVIDAPGLGIPLLADFDGDAILDLASGSLKGSDLIVAWGTQDGTFLDLGVAWRGFANARVMAVSRARAGDAPDFLFPSATRPEVAVYHGRDAKEMAAPSYTIPTKNAYTSLVAADMDGDGFTDLAGANGPKGTGLVSLLGADGQPRDQDEKPAGLLPLGVAVGLLDADPVPDLALACAGADQIALFHGLAGQAGGLLSDAILIPTIERPRDLTAADWNGDGRQDLAVIGITELAIQLASGDGSFAAPVSLIRDPARSHAGLVAADVNGDGSLDLLVLERRSGVLSILQGKGDGSFEAPVEHSVGESPVSTAVLDIDGDGLLDITIANAVGQSISVLLNRGAAGFTRAPDVWIGFSPQGHALAAADAAGGLMLVAFKGTRALVLPSIAAVAPRARFLRGDVDGSGRLELTDAILTLGRLFLGGEPLPCEDAADADDGGSLDIADAVRVLARLFLGGEILPPPGPEVCGEDPTRDALAACERGCPGR